MKKNLGVIKFAFFLVLMLIISSATLIADEDDSKEIQSPVSYLELCELDESFCFNLEFFLAIFNDHVLFDDIEVQSSAEFSEVPLIKPGSIQNNIAALAVAIEKASEKNKGNAFEENQSEENNSLTATTTQTRRRSGGGGGGGGGGSGGGSSSSSGDSSSTTNNVDGEGGNSGAIWTTNNDCGVDTQDENHYAIGDIIYINGANFDPADYNWTITGQPGGASCDPSIDVASSNETVNASGAFCFAAYTVQSDDCGEYKASFDSKHDNYRVDEAVCGDGIQQSGEQCDDGNANNNDACTNSCTLTFCGDNTVQDPNSNGQSEQCDDGNTVNTDACTNSCNFAVCGDGITGPGEQCDDGNTVNTDACTNSCNFAVCGDGITGPGEQCDDGNTNNDDGCNSLCVIEFCGDGTQQSGEQCDDGNTNNDDGCNSACVIEFCGDSIVNDVDEDCDDANQIDDDECTNSCTITFCGDGTIQTPNGQGTGGPLNDGNEECDDNNNLNGDGCSATCVIEEICAEPIDVMLVVDRSGTMNQPDGIATRLANAKTASNNFISTMDFTKDSAGLTSFNESVTLNQALTSTESAIHNAINALKGGGATNIGGGIKVGREELVANGGATQVMILLSDGAPNVRTLPNGSLEFCFGIDVPTACTQYAINESTLTKNAGIEIFTIGLGVSSFTEDLLQDIATVPENYFFTPNSTELESIYAQISEEICPEE